MLIGHFIAYPEIDLVQPGDKQFGVAEGVQIFQCRNIGFLQCVLRQKFIPQIGAGEGILLLVRSRVQLGKGVGVALPGMDNQSGNIGIIQIRHISYALPSVCFSASIKLT